MLCNNKFTSKQIDIMHCFNVTLIQILNMKVGLQTWYSDHSPLSLTLEIGRNLNESGCSIDNLEIVSAFIWDEEGKEKFTHALNSADTIEKLKDLVSGNQTDVNLLLGDFKSIILDVAKCTLSCRTPKKGRKHIKKPLEVELGPHYATLQKVFYICSEVASSRQTE